MSAFASKIIDKVGAGDAMLAIISMCLKAKIPNDLSLLLGSLAGAVLKILETAALLTKIN